jgi:hypothetical protein
MMCLAQVFEHSESDGDKPLAYIQRYRTNS